MMLDELLYRDIRVRDIHRGWTGTFRVESYWAKSWGSHKVEIQMEATLIQDAYVGDRYYEDPNWSPECLEILEVAEPIAKAVTRPNLEAWKEENAPDLRENVTVCDGQPGVSACVYAQRIHDVIAYFHALEDAVQAVYRTPVPMELCTMVPTDAFMALQAILAKREDSVGGTNGIPTSDNHGSTGTS